ncbi:MAG: hypothetical protein R3C03_03165 [Pirellulaceae bacterium]
MLDWLNPRNFQLLVVTMSNPYQAPLSEAEAPKDWVLQSSEPEAQAAARVGEFFSAQGYRLESGTQQFGCYGKGSNLLRLLFGAFVNRFRFQVTVRGNENGAMISVEKGMSGAMGGVIGYAKMKRELKRIREQLTVFINS